MATDTTNDDGAGEQQGRINIDSIYVMAGFNPRRHFDGAALTRLAESIRKDDVIEPLVVRRRPCDQGEYHLIAGERRLRAAREADLTSVPVIIRDYDDRQARRVAISENEEREDLAPSEEARKAQEVVDLFKGDRAAAAKEMGWSRSRLDTRLALLNATETVLEALDKREITLAMAELLASIPQSTQNGTVAKVIEQGSSVADVRERIKGIVIPLAEASFDLTECQTCPFNTKVQADFFSSSVGGDAGCTNRACFSRKTQEGLAERKTGLGEEYAVVRWASEVANDQFAPVFAEGDQGVGHAQLEACKQCPHFGAIIEDRLNGRTGEVRHDICFDVAAWREKRDAFQAQRQASTAPASTGADTSSKGSAPASGSTKRASGATGKSGVSSAAGGVPKGLYSHINAQACASAEARVSQSTTMILAYGLLGLMRYLASINSEDTALRERINKALTDAGASKTRVKGGISDADLLAALLHLDEGALTQLHRDGAMLAARQGANPGAGHPAQDAAAKRAHAVLAHAGVSLADFAPVDATFLSHLSRKAVEGVLGEAGFWTHVATFDDSETRRKHLRSAKAKELPERVMEQGFDWSGFVPSVVRELDPSPSSGGGGTTASTEGEAATASPSTHPVTEEQE